MTADFHPSDRTPVVDVVLTGIANCLVGLMIGMAVVSSLPMCFGVLTGILSMFVLYYSGSRVSRKSIVAAFVTVWLGFVAVIVGLYQI